MNFHLPLIIAVFVIGFGVVDRSVNGVDETLFKKCKQSNFCSRIRAQKVNEPSFEIDVARLEYDSNRIHGDIRNSLNKRFTFLLEPLVGESFRFLVDEPNGRRYRVVDSLKSEPKLGVFSQYNVTDDKLETFSGLNKVTLVFKPLRIDFYREGKIFVSLNEKQLMNVEHKRDKPQPVPSAEQLWWEEKFTSNDGTWIETKPYGPQAVALDVTFKVADVLFGIPEHADSFSLRTTTVNDSDPYRLFNLDVPFHDTSSVMALYGSVPVLYGHGAEGTAGIFWNNAAETWVDIYPNPTNKINAQAARFFSETGLIDVFVLLGQNPNSVFKAYTDLTGVTSLPQVNSLAYHQCRWNYMNESDLLSVNDGFNKYDLQMDTLWLDIEYTYKKWYYTWDKETFPNPDKMREKIESDGRRLNLIVDIHIARNTSYNVYNELLAKDLFVQNNNKTVYIGECWPGPSCYPDVLKKEARDYLAEQYQLTNFPGTDDKVMIWNDMNEPSTFNGPEKTFPRDNIHAGGWEHRDIHNIYGHYQLMSTHDGLMRRGKQSKRPFILTRAHFAGSQRYAAIWTGDNTATWEFLRAAIQMCLSEAVAGFSFCGADVGGFFNNPDAQLFERWYQAAAFQPFYRSHANLETKRREPWLYGNETMSVIRTAIRRRYTYLPFWYTLFYEHERFGLPVMRPLLTHYPTDKNVFTIDDEYLLSDILLVHPVNKPNLTEVKVYIPAKTDGSADLWYDIDDYTVFNTSGEFTVKVDRNKIPVYQRGGTILPKKETVRKTSAYMKNDPYTLVVCLNRQGDASGSLFVDDEESFNYQKGNYIYQRIQFSNNVLTKVIDQSYSNYTESKSNLTTIVVAGLKIVPTTVRLTVNSVVQRNLHFVIGNKSVEVHNVNVPIQDHWSIGFDTSGAYFIKSSFLILCFGIVIFILL